MYIEVLIRTNLSNSFFLTTPSKYNCKNIYLTSTESERATMKAMRVQVGVSHHNQSAYAIPNASNQARIWVMENNPPLPEDV